MDRLEDVAEGDRVLDQMGAADQCADAKVTGYLRKRPALSVVVGSEGVVYTVRPRGRARRDISALARTVKGALGSARAQAGDVQHVSAAAMERWGERTRGQAKAVAEQVNAVQSSNEYVLGVFDKAIEGKASDVYLDVNTRDDRARLRLRVYGRAVEAGWPKALAPVLEGDRLPGERGLELCRAMWAQSGGQFDASGPCDAAFEHRVAEEPGGARTRLYRIRANSVRDVVGVSVVCRVRDPSFVLPLEVAGYSERQLEHIQGIASSPGGLFLITGETNSGKSTTAASLLAALPVTKKIVAIEDPVEVWFAHVTHIEVNRYHKDAKEVFAKTLAATVRQNPDVLFLGEIRDEISAEAAMSMAIQGKRVISTVHTQSCAAAIPRLQQLGVEPHLLSLREFIAGIVNQNLVPLVCPSCGLDAHPEPALETRYRRLFGDGVRHINAEGCEQCTEGVVGQTLVAEVFPLCMDRTGEPQRLIAAQQYVELETYMRRVWGAESKHDHAASKIAAGLVDPTECEGIIGAWTDDEHGRKDTAVVRLDGQAR